MVKPHTRDKPVRAVEGSRREATVSRGVGYRALATMMVASCVFVGGQAPAAAAATPIGMYRLTGDQYRNSVTDTFGDDIVLGGYFEPMSRRAHGLLATGSYAISVSPAGAEQYASMAQNIALQVVDEKHRAELVGCAPSSVKQPDDRCARQFFGRIGPLLFRRPLTHSEVQERVELSHRSATALGDFYQGLAAGLVSMLVSPRFLFQMEFGTKDPKQA